MKNITRVLFVLIALSLVFSLNTVVYGQDAAKPEEIKCAGCAKVMAEKTEFKVECKEKVLYFCCKECMEAFKKEHCKEGAAACCKKEAAAVAEVFVCSKEGCKYKADKAGKCPTCNVDLVKHVCKTSFACPMKECDYKAEAAGKCPKCGMELKEVKCCTAAAKTECTHKH